jgi:GDPmannose 4,6-dehydratase
MAKRALITGVTGQDGSYLAEFLLDQGYEVIGMVRRSSTPQLRADRPHPGPDHLVAGDLLDEVSMINILRDTGPTRSTTWPPSPSCRPAWNQPVLTGETTALGVTRVLDAIRLVDPEIRFYQASSSEMFGKVQEVPQTETTPLYPAAPTAWPRSTATGSPSTTARATTSTPPRASSSTTSPPGAGSSS